MFVWNRIWIILNVKKSQFQLPTMYYVTYQNINKGLCWSTCIKFLQQYKVLSVRLGVSCESFEQFDEVTVNTLEKVPIQTLLRLTLSYFVWRKKIKRRKWEKDISSLHKLLIRRKMTILDWGKAPFYTRKWANEFMLIVYTNFYNQTLQASFYQYKL